jgi:hypothetical protein
MGSKGLFVGVVVLVVFLVVIGFLGLFETPTALVSLGFSDSPTKESGVYTIGPSIEEQTCMKNCAIESGCTPMDMQCMTSEKSSACKEKCNVKKPETTQETSCMEECVLRGCSEFDFDCQTQNQVTCEKECNMIKEPEPKNEEEKCIRDCVNATAPGTICAASQTGETGNELCQKCAKECEHLYSGPCLDDAKLREMQRACETCEHCYGEPVNGPSGEGWDCIVDVKCLDSSSEFGDNPGTGEGIAKSDTQDGQPENNGIIETISNVVESAASTIINFIDSLFGIK